jgi:excisionase family DNA binding protein
MSADLIPRKAYFRIAEVAQMLTISQSVVYRLIRLGELPADRFGKTLRISHADLRRYIEGARVKVEVQP